MNHFNALIDDLDAIQRRRAAASDAAIVRERNSRAARRELFDLAERIRGSGRTGDRISKALNATLRELTTMQKTMAKSTVTAEAEQRSERRAEDAMRLSQILRELDQAIADGKITAEETAVIENAVNNVAKRLGLI
jgi:hypothetical protein